VPGAPVYVYGVPTLPHINPPEPLTLVVSVAPLPPEVILVGVPNVAGGYIEVFNEVERGEFQPDNVMVSSSIDARRSSSVIVMVSLLLT
jgi:hypothetical protein